MEQDATKKQPQQDRPSQQPGEPPEQQPGKPHKQQGKQQLLCKQQLSGQQTNSSHHNHQLIRDNSKHPSLQLQSKGNSNHRYHLLHSRDSNNQEPQDHQDLRDQQQTWWPRIHHPTSSLHWPQC